MEETFQIPARPWTEADVAFLTRNADYLPEDIRGELGLTPAIPDNNFQADFDAARAIETPVAETEETIVVTQEILDENPVLAEAGVQVGDVGVATNDVPEGAMIEDVPVVDNTATDNA